MTFAGKNITYTITLQSDACIGSGFGGEFVNSFVARDPSGNPILHASHIKGLLRQSLCDILEPLGRTPAIEALFGSPGWRPALPAAVAQQAGGGYAASAHFDDARWQPPANASGPRTRLITRTAINPNSGTALGQTLRTQEAVAAGGSFLGQIRDIATVAEDLLLRLALLSISAVGGNRNRGGGQCLVSIHNESRSPGQLLEAWLSQNPVPAPPATAAFNAPAAGTAISGAVDPSRIAAPTAWFDVKFVADSGILCPETPETLNLLHSGIAIPASAMQGALLHRINREDTQLATRLFGDPCFRAWPAHPCALGDQSPLPFPVRVSITHKTNKIIGAGLQRSEFIDEALETVNWENRPADAPMLKSADGVLLAADQSVQLWKANDMPRLLTTHGVHSDSTTPGGRNVYTIEAMGAMVFRGLLAVPEYAAPAIQKAFPPAGAAVFLGKARSVRGGGTLHLYPVADPAALCPPWRSPRRAVIAQSPILLPDTPAQPGFQQEFIKIARDWATTFGLPHVDMLWAVAGLRFGWNRHGLAGAARHGRARACRVVLPGAVLQFEKSPDRDHLWRGLLAGIGGGRERGYGCLLPHPGKAQAHFQREVRIPELAPTPEAQAIRDGIAFAGETRLSPSQIAGVLSQMAAGSDKLRSYLNQQKRRGSAGWQAWEKSFVTLERMSRNPDGMRTSLEVARDLLVAQKEDER